MARKKNELVTTGKMKPQKRIEKKIDTGKAFRMRASGYSQSAIAEHFGCSPQAVSAALKKFEPLLERAEIVPDDRSLGKLFRGAALAHVVASAEPKKMARMDGKAHAVAAGILIEKERLVTGQSTGNLDLSIMGLVAKLSGSGGGLARSMGKVIDAEPVPVGSSGNSLADRLGHNI